MPVPAASSCWYPSVVSMSTSPGSTFWAMAETSLGPLEPEPPDEPEPRRARTAGRAEAAGASLDTAGGARAARRAEPRRARAARRVGGGCRRVRRRIVRPGHMTDPDSRRQCDDCRHSDDGRHAAAAPLRALSRVRWRWWGGPAVRTGIRSAARLVRGRRGAQVRVAGQGAERVGRAVGKTAGRNRRRARGWRRGRGDRWGARSAASLDMNRRRAGEGYPLRAPLAWALVACRAPERRRTERLGTQFLRPSSCLLRPKPPC